MNSQTASFDALADSPESEVAKGETPAPVAGRAEPEVHTLASHHSSNLDRLLCADVYCSGLYGSILALIRLRGAPFRAKDPGTGFDQRTIAFHACQSALISVVYLALGLLLLLGPGRAEMNNGSYGSVAILVSTLVAAKILFVNFWLPRIIFGGSTDSSVMTIPGVSRTATWLRDRLFPPDSGVQANTIYFAGDRPFVGYGTEVNSWCVVIDTSAPGSGLHDLVGATPQPRPITTAELYDAVRSGVASVNVESMRCDQRLFIDGVDVDEEKRAAGRRFRRPPERLSTERIDSLDAKATSGRSYMMLQMQQPTQDLLVTLFLRFYKEGKLVFCEFSSYVLPPGPASLYRIGHCFRINGLLYSVYAIGIALITGIVYSILYLIFAEIMQNLASPGFLRPLLLPAIVMPVPLHAAFSAALAHKNELGLISGVWNFGLMGYAVVVMELVYVCLQLLFQGIRWLIAAIGILFNVSRQFGVPFTYRERFATRASLKYYSLQEVVRFLKIQEKILIRSILELLKERGIDTCDFRESLTAYINQGVINSGDIRGSVFTRIKSFVGRRPARSAVKRTGRRAVGNA